MLKANSLAHEFAQRLNVNRHAFQAFLRQRVDDEAVAEDLLQQSLLKAVQHYHDVRNDESVMAWFYKILRHTVIDYYRSKAAEAHHQDRFLQDAAVLVESQAPPPDEIKPTVCGCLERLLPGLRPAYAELIRRIDLAEEPLATVARDLKISPNNATVRLHRARQALRASLEEACGVCSTHGCLNCTCE
jgi:RNA polymerase sigma factor (sigma-70 family)